MRKVWLHSLGQFPLGFLADQHSPAKRCIPHLSGQDSEEQGKLFDESVIGKSSCCYSEGTKVNYKLYVVKYEKLHVIH